jgi:hypothetical protein
MFMASFSIQNRPRRIILLYDVRNGEVLDFFAEGEMEAIMVVDAIPTKITGSTDDQDDETKFRVSGH